MARVRAERDQLRVLTQQLARVVHVLELEKHALEEATGALEQDLAARGDVTDLATRRQRPPPVNGPGPVSRAATAGQRPQAQPAAAFASAGVWPPTHCSAGRPPDSGRAWNT
ncbi:hypothetical protein [Streptomyces sp. NPDC002394]